VSSEIQSVISPRRTSAWSYSAQLFTRYFVLYLGWTLDLMPRSWLTHLVQRDGLGSWWSQDSRFVHQRRDEGVARQQNLDGNASPLSTLKRLALHCSPGAYFSGDGS
jgi:hypothetical protein